MTKVRPIGSPHEAIDRTAAALGGYEAAADVIGRTHRYLRDAGDQDRDGDVKLEEVLRLEEAVLKAGGCGYFLALIQAVHDRVARPVPQGDPVDMALSAFASAGKMADVMRHAVCPMGDGGREITPRETDAARRAIAEVKAHLDDLDQRLATTQARYDANPGLRVAK